MKQKSRGKHINDIYSQLSVESEEARQKYDRRIDRNLTIKDYFEEAVVKELADGDAGRMGAHYPANKHH